VARTPVQATRGAPARSTLERGRRRPPAGATAKPRPFVPPRPHADSESVGGNAVVPATYSE
jgi:hypothetical protein